MLFFEFITGLNLAFTSLTFVVFAFLVLLTYHLVPKNKWIVLLVASLLFYLTWGIEKLPFIVVSALIAYVASRMISGRLETCEEQVKSLQNDADGKEQIKKLRANTKKVNKRTLIIAVVLLLLMLIYVKAGRLLVDALSMKDVSIIVPLGISYYTFSLIAYLADC